MSPNDVAKAEYPRVRMLTDPPEPGRCKLRVRSDGAENTHVLVVDHEGNELELDYVNGVVFRWEGGAEIPEVTIRAQPGEVELDVVDVRLTSEEGEVSS